MMLVLGAGMLAASFVLPWIHVASQLNAPNRLPFDVSLIDTIRTADSDAVLRGTWIALAGLAAGAPLVFAGLSGIRILPLAGAIAAAGGAGVSFLIDIAEITQQRWGPGLGMVTAFLGAAVGFVAVLGSPSAQTPEPSSPDTSPPRSRYDRLRKLGSGAFGTTYLARHHRLGKLVAVKELSAGSGATEQMLREARIAAGVRHPNVVEVYDVEEDTSGGRIVMEYVEGGTLEGLLANGKVSRADALEIWKDVLLGLDAIHAADIVHRDVKPSNILLAKDGTAKLSDFGVARAPGEATVAGTGSPVGTPLYMAPEQLQGKAPSARSDLYAASAVAYLMLAGRHPWSGSSAELAAAMSPRRPAVKPIASQPDWLNRLLMRGLAYDPADRPASARAMLREIEKGTGGAVGRR